MWGLVYNRFLQGLGDCRRFFRGVQTDLERRTKHASYLSAEETASQNGTRIPQKNVYCERPQGACPQKSKRQKAAQLLRLSQQKATLKVVFFLHKEGFA